MKLRIEITTAELRALVVRELEAKLGEVVLDKNFLQIQVKSKQNYKSEWEDAEFRAVYEKNEVK